MTLAPNKIWILSDLTWLILGLAWAFFTFRIWQYFQKRKGEVAKLFFYFSVFLTTSFFIYALGEFLFALAPNKEISEKIMIWSMILGAFVGNIGFVSLGYLVFRIRFPHFSPQIAFLIFFTFAFLILILDILFPPLLLPTGTSTYHFIPGILNFALMAGTAFPLGIMFFQEARSFKEKEERVKTVGLATLCLSGIVASFFCVVVANDLIRIFILTLWAVGVFIITFLTQRPSAFYVKRV
jgi:hypothetical protein